MIGLVRKRNNEVIINNIIYMIENNWIEKILEFELNIIINIIVCYGRYNEFVIVLIESNIFMFIRVLEFILLFDVVFINCGILLLLNMSLYVYIK